MLCAVCFALGRRIPPSFVQPLLREDSPILKAILEGVVTRQQRELQRKSGGGRQGKRPVRLSVPKLDDAVLAGGSKANECTLILTEGDSAKSLAVAGLGVIGRERYGVFPLKGKLLNVRDANVKQISLNAELNHIKTILGLNHNRSYESPADLKTLRYGRVMLMTDQDHDGIGYAPH